MKKQIDEVMRENFGIKLSKSEIAFFGYTHVSKKEVSERSLNKFFSRCNVRYLCPSRHKKSIKQICKVLNEEIGRNYQSIPNDGFNITDEERLEGWDVDHTIDSFEGDDSLYIEDPYGNARTISFDHEEEAKLYSRKVSRKINLINQE
jgi:hypothetical protein